MVERGGGWRGRAEHLEDSHNKLLQITININLILITDRYGGHIAGMKTLVSAINLLQMLSSG